MAYVGTTKESETVFKMKRSAAGAVKANFNKFMEKESFSILDIEEVIRLFFIDEDIIRSWYAVINKLRDDGKYILPKKLENKFREDANTQFAKKCTYELDPTARLLVMGATDMYDEISFFMRFPDCIVSNFKLPGTYGCIEGVPRSGKTSFACTLMPIFHDVFKIDTITNIVINNAPSYIHQVKKLSDLVVKMDELKRWVCILDETGTFVGRKRALSTENVDFENLARFIGKMGGRMIMITHSFQYDIPTLLQTWITERYKKLDKDRVLVRLERDGGFVKMNRILKDVPDSDLEYITEDITSLEFDISIKKLLEQAQSGASISSIVQAQRKEIPTRSKNKEVIYKAIDLLKTGEYTQKQIADMLGVTRAFISYIYRTYVDPKKDYRKKKKQIRRNRIQ